MPVTSLGRLKELDQRIASLRHRTDTLRRQVMTNAAYQVSELLTLQLEHSTLERTECWSMLTPDERELYVSAGPCRR